MHFPSVPKVKVILVATLYSLEFMGFLDALILIACEPTEDQWIAI